MKTLNPGLFGVVFLLLIVFCVADGYAYYVAEVPASYGTLFVWENGELTGTTVRTAEITWQMPSIENEKLSTFGGRPETYQCVVSMKVYGPNGLIHSGNDLDTQTKILLKDNFEKRSPYGYWLEAGRMTLPSQRYNCHGFTFTRGASDVWMTSAPLLNYKNDGILASCGSSTDPHEDADIAWHDVSLLSIKHSSAYLMYSTINGIRTPRFIGKLGLYGMYVLERWVVNGVYNVPAGKQQPEYYAFQ